MVLGLIFFFIIASVEYFLWLNSYGRLVLLILFITVEGLLLFRFILVPAAFLFKFRKGITHKSASLLIGRHFPEVDDKLYNLLDLADHKEQSELLLASIEQRSGQLKTIPFSTAIDFKENVKYAKYLLIPALFIALLMITGSSRSFFGSYKRVMNFDIAYEPPAPFYFRLLSENMRILEDQAHTVHVITIGEVKPEDVYINIGGTDYLLQLQNGQFHYTFTPPLESVEFYFKANGVLSRKYLLEVLRAPSIYDFRLNLAYPDYLGKPRDNFESTGNATFPEGTRVTWAITGKHTEQIRLVTSDTMQTFQRTGEKFQLAKTVYSDMTYELTTSNGNVKDYEKLNYKFRVIKDASPSIKVDQTVDSLLPNVAYYSGEVADDYGVRLVNVICYPENRPDERQQLEIARPVSNFQQFYYTFPSGLVVDAGERYELYFEVTDNDAIHGGKTGRSQVFRLAVLDSDQLESRSLKVQESLLNQMDKSLEQFKEQKDRLEGINKVQKEKTNLSFSDQRQIKEFLKNQKQQEQLMEKFSSRLKENLENKKADSPTNEMLRERLQRQEINAKKNEKLLDELSKIAEKIDKAALAKKLEELGKQQQNSERGLEQLLELTKRYYVTEKAAQLGRELEKEGLKQDKLPSQTEVDQKKEQEELNRNFESISKELQQLSKDNEKLKKPMDLGIDAPKEAGIKSDQQEALKELERIGTGKDSDSQDKEKAAGNKAKQKQKSAAQKMQEMGKALAMASAAGGGASSDAEDAEMLRQVLDNLVTFSFEQESLYDELEVSDSEISHFSGSVRRQQELRDLFEHVDDSLFALSLRRVELSEFVNEQITEVYYNIDKSLESIAENQIYQGVSFQQYVLTASNNLADYLANTLDNMQESLAAGQGSGSGKGFQLPDIIQSQGELQEKLGPRGKSGEKGESGSSGDEGKGKEGSGKGEGKEGDEGEGAGKNGQTGQGDNGQEGGKAGSGQADTGESEQDLQEVYEIYKEQQQIRNQLEQQLENLIKNTDKQLAKGLIRQMEDFENELLENGITQQTVNRMNLIQHQLLKLENAAMQQGEKQERESTTGEDQFRNPIVTKPELLRNDGRDVENLNRQSLPLRPIYLKKVKDYFKNDD